MKANHVVALLKGGCAKCVSALKKAMSFIYPPFCVLCDKTMNHGDEGGLCEACQEKYPILKDDLCCVCSKPLVDNKKDRCQDCRRKVHFFDEGKGLWLYESDVKEAIHRYKYKNRREMAPLFAKIMGRYYNDYSDWSIDYVMPVPLHAKKLKQRGFNQTEMMAKAFAKETGVRLLNDGLSRCIETRPQEGLSDKARVQNVKNAFVCHNNQVAGKNILLLDDVYTTGATLDGCARALVDCGAKEIYFITIAVGRGY